MVATLLNLMDGISRTDGVLVIAATNRPDVIEPALRRPGRLDKEIEIGVPSPKQRLDILHTLLSEMKHSLVHLQVQQLATTTHGFVGADLAALCNEAALVCLRRFAKIKKFGGDLHSNGTVVAYESCSDSIVEGSDCLGNIRDSSSDCLDSSSSYVSDFPVSSVSNITDNFQKGNSTSSKQTTLMEEESILKLIFEDFEKARMKVRPSAMEVILEVPKVNWDDVGGQREVKTQLMEAVEWPQKHQDAFKRIGTRPLTGVLMFGPPGCSKTLMARAVASEAGLNFLAVKGPELFSKWVGESEKAVRSLFSKARANAPSIIFFDEIDGFAFIRGKERDGVSVSDRIMSQLLVELDGLHQRVDVTVIAATNRPDKIDPALLRSGRFDRLLYVGPPNETDREEIFCIHLRKIPCSSDVSIKELACLTKGYTGADISLICREVAVAAIEESLDAAKITMQHFKIAIRQVQPLKIQSYQELSARFQRLVHSEDKSVISNAQADETGSS
ncbi:LOW QUALITY PROTEIN: AAA domain-containing protein, partial [Cephalotus follicularis]